MRAPGEDFRRGGDRRRSIKKIVVLKVMGFESPHLFLKPGLVFSLKVEIDLDGVLGIESIWVPVRSVF